MLTLSQRNIVLQVIFAEARFPAAADFPSRLRQLMMSLGPADTRSTRWRAKRALPKCRWLPNRPAQAFYAAIPALARAYAPKSEEALQYFLGFAVVNDDLGEAEQIFVERLKAAPLRARPLAMFQMQQFLLRAKDKAAAFALEDRVLAPYGDMLESHLILAQGAFALGDNERARTEAEQALRIKPDSELAILTTAQVSGDIDAALKVLSTFLDKYPKSREVRAAYARILVDSKQTEQARKEFLVLLKDQPDNLATLYALGVIGMQSNDIPAAEKYFTSFANVLAEHPSDERDPSKVLMILSQIAEQRNDLDAAYNWLDKVEGNDEKIYLAARMKIAAADGSDFKICNHWTKARKFFARAQSQSQAVEQVANLSRLDAADCCAMPATMVRKQYTVLQDAVKKLSRQSRPAVRLRA